MRRAASYKAMWLDPVWPSALLSSPPGPSLSSLSCVTWVWWEHHNPHNGNGPCFCVSKIVVLKRKLICTCQYVTVHVYHCLVWVRACKLSPSIEKPFLGTVSKAGTNKSCPVCPLNRSPCLICNSLQPGFCIFLYHGHLFCHKASLHVWCFLFLLKFS